MSFHGSYWLLGLVALGIAFIAFFSGMYMDTLYMMSYVVLSILLAFLNRRGVNSTFLDWIVTFSFAGLSAGVVAIVRSAT